MQKLRSLLDQRAHLLPEVRCGGWLQIVRYGNKTRQRIHSINVSDADFKWLGLKAHVCTASRSRYSMTFVLLTAPPSPDRNSLNTSADRIVSPPINTKA